MPDRPWKDEYTLLCEKCGYVIEGLERDDRCPECGRLVADSTINARPGTPSQRSTSIKSHLRAMRRIVTSPRPLFLEMSFHGDRANSPAFTTIALSVIICWCLMLFEIVLKPDSVLGTVIYVGALTIFAVFILVGVYVWNQILCVAVWILTKLAGNNRPERFAFIVGGHASAAWLLTGLIWVVGYLAASMYYISVDPQTDYEQRQAVAVQINSYYTPAFLGGLLLGTLLFLYFMWLGYAHTRFLNPRRSQGGEP